MPAAFTSSQLPLRAMPLWTRCVCSAQARPAWLQMVLTWAPLSWQWARDDSDTSDSGASRTERMQEVDDQLSDFEDSEISQSWGLMEPVYLYSMLQCPWYGPTLRPDDNEPDDP